MSRRDDVPDFGLGICVATPSAEPGIAQLRLTATAPVSAHDEQAAALGRLLDWAFGDGGIRTVVWQSLAGDLASWRGAWAAGFVFEGVTRGTELRRDEVLDGWRAALLATDTREPKTRWLPHPVLTDGWVTLRPVSLRDEGRYLETVHDAESHRWLSDIPLSRDAASFRRQVRDAGLGPSLGAAVQWAIADAVSDAYVGGLALFGLNGLDHRSAEVGYRSHPDARGQGYVSGALRLALQQAFRDQADGGYGLERISLGAGDGNLGSQAVARSCGFTETGRDRRCYRLDDDSVVDLIRFDLLADEWLHH